MIGVYELKITKTELKKFSDVVRKRKVSIFDGILVELEEGLSALQVHRSISERIDDSVSRTSVYNFLKSNPQVHCVWKMLDGVLYAVFSLEPF